MTLRTRILVARGLLFAAGAVVLLILAMRVHWFWVLLIVPWLVQRPQILRRIVLPILFPAARCPNPYCRSRIPLAQRWQIGEQYKHNRVAHVLAVHDDRGREIGKFECPGKSCRATIPVQKGTAKTAKGTIIGGSQRIARSNRPVTRGIADSNEPPMPLGVDRDPYPAGRIRTLVDQLSGRTTGKAVLIDSETYGRHACIFGKSGMGKSTLLNSHVEWILENGLGATVIDPAGDLVDDILRLVPEKRRDDVILIRVRDESCPFRLNLLETHSPAEAINLNYEMLSALQSVSRSWGESISYQLELGIETARQFGGSLRDVFELFTRPSFRFEVMAELQDEELIEFWERYEKLTPTSKAPVIRKLRGLIKHKLLGPMLGAETSDFDADAIIRERKLVLVDLNTDSTADDVKVILGTFLIGKIRAAALRQPRHGRRRHFLIVDEAVDFMHEGMNFPKLFSQARKQKLSLILASQHVTQMPDKVRESAFANSGVLVSFNVDLDDARLFAARMEGVAAEEITAQSPGECVARIGNAACFVKTKLPSVPETDQTAYIVNRMQKIRQTVVQTKRNTVRAAHDDPSVSRIPLANENVEVIEGVR